jgi:molecular chaperone GrpE
MTNPVTDPATPSSDPAATEAEVNPSVNASPESEDASTLAPDLEAALREAEAHAETIADAQPPRDQDAETLVTDSAEVQDQEASSSVDPQEEVKKLKAQLEQAQKQQEDLKQNALRARADLENARRRFEREKKEDQLFAGERVLKGLVPVVDDLDRALESAPADLSDAQSFIEGVQMVHRKFLQALEAQGAKSFYPLGEAFDPTTHEALMEMPSEEVEPGHIAQVFQRGWMLNDRLLRPAKVIIAKAP